MQRRAQEPFSLREYMRFKINFFCILVLGFLNAPVSAEVVHMGSITEMAEEWEKIDNMTLVVFDVDEVLITSKDHAFHAYANGITQKFIKNHRATATTPEMKEEFNNTLSIATLNSKRVLIEEETP